MNAAPGLEPIPRTGGHPHIGDEVFPNRARPADDPGHLKWTPELQAELLDPASWRTVLQLRADALKLAVALLDANGRLVGTCHNPQPIWSLARAALPEWTGGCPFCLETGSHCTAAADALRSRSLTLAHDPGGFAHIAVSLTLGDRHVGTLLAGQVLDRYPESLPLRRVALDFGLSPQRLWQLARQQAPVSRASLKLYGELLGELGQVLLRDLYRVILDRTWTESTAALNHSLANANASLNRKVRELDRSNSDLRNLFNSTQQATIFLDSDLLVKKFTPAAEAWLGLGAGDLDQPLASLAGRFAAAGVSALAPSPEEQPPSLVERAAEAIATFPTGFCPDHRVVRELDAVGASGGHYLMRLLPYCTTAGLIDGAVMTFIDVTTLKDAELRAEGARVYAEKIVATVPVPLLVLDDQFLVQSANDAFYKTFQVGAGESEGRLLYELGNGQWKIPELRRLLDELLPRDQWVRDFEMEHNFERIGPKTMLLNARRINPGRLILLTIEDITERKRSETLLRKAHLDLQSFSHAASHDLQEPLRMVKIYTQLLAQSYRGKLDPEADQFIAFAMDGAARLETLLRDLRAYWLATDGEIQRVPTDAGAVLQKAIETLQVSIAASGATVTHQALPMVLADETSLAMLFQNLLGNGIKYSRPGVPPKIDISARKTAREWCFSVSDNGIGIQPEYLETVFAPFKRLHGSDYTGSGIGLALCHNVVERYGGRLWVESVPGQGSTFHFTIPDSAETV